MDNSGIMKPTPERLEARRVEAERKEREMLRPYTLEDHYFMATKGDAEELDGATPFHGERYKQPTLEDYTKDEEGILRPPDRVDSPEVMTVFMKSKDSKKNYLKLCVEVDEFKEFWLELGAKTSVAKLNKKPKEVKKGK